MTLPKCTSAARFEFILETDKGVTDWNVSYARRRSSLIVYVIYVINKIIGMQIFSQKYNGFNAGISGNPLAFIHNTSSRAECNHM